MKKLALVVMLATATSFAGSVGFAANYVNSGRAGWAEMQMFFLDHFPSSSMSFRDDLF